MSRITYVSQYFVSADQPGGVRHWQHTRALARAGHDVTVVTSYVQHKERTVPERYRGRRMVRETEDGLDVWRTYSTPGYGRDLRSRIANYGTFALWSAVAGARAPRPDVVVASSPSLPSAAAAAAMAAARGARFVLEVRDLWPDSAIAMGLVRDRHTIRVARTLESYCYRRADRIVALTEGIRDGMVELGVSPAKITLITNGVDLEIGAPDGRPADVPVPGDAFVAMYVGAHGTYSSLETVLGAAELLRDLPGARVVLVGNGDRKPSLVEEARRRGLDNVVFADPVPKRDVPAWLARADACLLPYQDNELFAGALPNKAFDYLGAGRPIVAAAPAGELTRMVERAGCGVAVPPEDPAALAGAIRALASDPGGARRMGAAGRAYALEHYDRAALAERFVAVVESVA
ncbi:glycosyltransferase family 4 protein [Miltoncostaea marina]|uniref:glycosyltransferase family 4 protein n=1 Tax=Miltoncostaea marina TaxID=2843215 RepID=UPI001C3CFB2F|nr:glycosyltransferase family 4 protein [Miltoncostaea marina]